MAISKQELVQLAQFRSALRRFLRSSEDRARAAGVTPQQYQMLLAIKGTPERDWATVGEIADALQVAHNAAVQLVNRAAEAGLVLRSEHATDRRSVVVSLTAKGDAVLSALAAKNKRELTGIGGLLAAMSRLGDGSVE